MLVRFLQDGGKVPTGIVVFLSLVVGPSADGTGVR
jgi:hypothetical protein